MQPDFFYNFHILDINENMVEKQEDGECFIPLGLLNEFYGREIKWKDHSGSQDLAITSFLFPSEYRSSGLSSHVQDLSFTIRLTHWCFKLLSRCTKHLCTNFIDL